MKPRTTLLALCMAALVTLGTLATLATLGACSSNLDDRADIGTPAANTPGQPIALSIAPKQSFISGDAGTGAGTRAAVDETTGAMTWTTGDRIFVRFAFDNPAATVATCTYILSAAGTWEAYEGVVANYDGGYGNTIDLNTQPKATYVWPLDATKVSVRAVYTDQTIDNGDIYIAGSLDAMKCTLTDVPLSTPITLALKHVGTRLVFTGLTPDMGYEINAPCPCPFKLQLDTEEIITTSDGGGSFTDASGTLVLCPILTGSTLVELRNGPTNALVYSATIAGGIAKSYQCPVKHQGGGFNPGDTPDLLAPKPIVAGNAVQLTNGYYITVPFAYATASDDVNVKWHSTDPTAATMENDPCAGHGDWRMPTMKDWEAIFGWTTSSPWSQSATIGGNTPLAMEILSSPVIAGYRSYWSSTLHTGDNKVWTVITGSYNSASYEIQEKSYTGCSVRCVQKQ